MGLLFGILAAVIFAAVGFDVTVLDLSLIQELAFGLVALTIALILGFRRTFDLT